jgi:hypothetical protein
MNGTNFQNHHDTRRQTAPLSDSPGKPRVPWSGDNLTPCSTSW